MTRLLSLLLVLFLAPAVALAAHPDTQRLADLPPSEVLIEAESGRVLHEKNADLVRPPASMLKLMMMLMVAEGLQSGAYAPELPIPTNLHAQSMGGTQVHLSAGETWPLARMMRAVAIASANDATMAVAQTLWGSEAGYLEAMNQRARELGMLDTEFHSVHGLPPDEGEEFDATTARDMGRLAMACLEHPLVMNWAAKKEMLFREDEPLKYSTNKLLWRMEGCDGLKTGYIRAAGFCVAATAERDGVRLVAVVMGWPTKYGRFNRAQELMETAFNDLRPMAVFDPGLAVGPDIKVSRGVLPTVRGVPQSLLKALMTAAEREYVRYEYDLPTFVEAPLTEGQPVGTVTAFLGSHMLGTTELLAPVEVPLDGWKLVLVDGEASWIGLDH